jgi:hypothetical protein
MADDIANEVEKLAAFIEPAPKVAGLALRPFTAASLIILRKTGNKLLAGDESNVEFDVAAFLYAHTDTPKQVRESSATAEAWESAVLTFADTLSVRDFITAANEIKGIMERAMVGQDYAVDQEPAHPN